MKRGVYEFDALGTLQAAGVTHIDIWCVHLPCVHRKSVEVAALIERRGPATTLVMIARKARCDVCKRLGAHVQPRRPAPIGTGDYDPSFDPFAWAKDVGAGAESPAGRSAVRGGLRLVDSGSDGGVDDRRRESGDQT